MSGICGIFDTDPGKVRGEDLDAIVKALERRGPERSSVWRGESIALGHTLLATTPEALVEPMPLLHSPSGCAITADARLDNRDDLIARLGLSDNRGSLGDGELILLSYLKWSRGFVEHLLGDFAFAIWDPRTREVVCARDPMGMRQLHFALVGTTGFVFATDPEAVLRHSKVGHALNQARIADYLADYEACELGATFYHDVQRLPPAKLMVFGASGMSAQTYWRLEEIEELNLPNDQAYSEAFLEVFTEAVRCRLRCAGKVGAMLSGGVDSGSVAALASRLLDQQGQGPLMTFSAIGPDQDQCKETAAIRRASTIPYIDPAFVSFDKLAEFQADLEALTDNSGEPFDNDMTLIRAVYLLAAKRGVKVVLDGVAGDTTLPRQDEIPSYMRRLQWGKAWREAKGRAQFWHSELSAWQSLARGMYLAVTPSWLRDLRGELARRFGAHQDAGHPLITPEFAERIDFETRRELNRLNLDPITHGLSPRQFSLVHPYIIVARERYDRVASALAIEARDPFRDIRLVKFCASLPAEQIEASGWPKIVLRRAVQGHLPNEVIWRMGKEHLGPQFTRNLFKRRSLPWGRSPNWADRVSPFMASSMLAAADQWRANDANLDVATQAFALAIWLQNHVNAGP
ncbi:asparagine synthase-related protein [Altererythrobacter sp. GH1-8]|uniref:asparagine synthase-related protein n=1 Tax=Altererythrobacter sp. GH1-8 TaxID=3349333 RepID=UPI00374D4297